MIDAGVLLSLIGDLQAQLLSLRAQNAQLRQQLAEVEQDQPKPEPKPLVVRKESA